MLLYHKRTHIAIAFVILCVEKRDFFNIFEINEIFSEIFKSK